MGLIHRAIEEAGIPGISLTLFRDIAEQVKPPRAVHVKFPFGSPLGEPGNAEKQKSIIRDAFRYLKEIQAPGTIVDLEYKFEPGKGAKS